MKIVVIGGLDSSDQNFPKLREQGHEAVRHHLNRVSTLLPGGTGRALKGASVVVDVRTLVLERTRRVMNFFETSTLTTRL